MQDTGNALLASQLIFTCSRSTTETAEKGVKYVQKYINTSKGVKYIRRRSGVSIVNFEHISHLFFTVFIIEFEQINVSWINKHFQYFTEASLKTNKERNHFLHFLLLYYFRLKTINLLRANLIDFVFLDHHSLVNTG